MTIWARCGHRLDQGDRCQHVAVERLDPVLALELAEIARRTSACIVDQNIGHGAGGEKCVTAFFGVTSATTVWAGGRRRRDLGALQHITAMGSDNEVDALVGERLGAGLAEPLTSCAHHGVAFLQSQIHVSSPSIGLDTRQLFGKAMPAGSEPGPNSYSHNERL
jgi:hypothetical protein